MSAPGRDELPLLDAAFDAIFTFGLPSNVITYWNRGAEELYGYSREEALGREPPALLKSRHTDSREAVMRQLLANGRWEGEIVQTAKSGRELQIEARWSLQRDGAGEPVAVLEINRDVSEQRDLGRRYQLLVDRVQEYAIFLLDTQGRVKTWNAGAERIKGYTGAEIVGRELSVFYTPEDLAAGYPAKALRMAESNGHHAFEGWRLRKDGSRFWASVVITALRDSSGRLTGFAKVTRDDTQRRMEVERLLELDRAKTNFLNLAAHELRGPLTVIAGYLSMIEEGLLGPVDPRVQAAIIPLRGKTEEMNAMVEQMVEAARIEEGSTDLKLASVDLGAVAAAAVRSASALVGKQHRLELEGENAGASVRADPSRIRTIVGNLISNAVKYSPDGGLISVRVRRDGRHASIEVEDHGVGIPAPELPKLFTRFGRIVTPETRHIPGTGLGLYLSRELARLHGGDLTVLSRHGKGSLFTLSLPLDVTAT